MPCKPGACGRRGLVASWLVSMSLLHRAIQGPEEDRSAQPSPLPLGPCRVRSIIMLQEKAQDRERLLLKFIKIMKVSVALTPSGAPPGGGQPGPPCACPHGLPASLQHLRKLNNFNSYLAILSALDSAPIRRLEWQKQTSEVSGCDRTRLGQARRPGLGSLLCRQPAVGLGQPTHLSFLSLISSLGRGGLVVGAAVVLSQRLPPAPQACAAVPASPAPSFSSRF